MRCNLNFKVEQEVQGPVDDIRTRDNMRQDNPQFTSFHNCWTHKTKQCKVWQNNNKNYTSVFIPGTHTKLSAIMSASYASGCSIEVRMHGGGSPEDSAAQISAQPAPVMPIVCLPSTYRELLRRWSNFNSQARRRNKGRGIAVTMRRCTYLSLITQPCAYCGARPLPGQFVGVDRLRSDGIYSPENSVPCCKVCNFMKGSLSVPQFFSHLKAIAAHQKLNMDQAYCYTL